MWWPLLNPTGFRRRVTAIISSMADVYEIVHHGGGDGAGVGRMQCLLFFHSLLPLFSFSFWDGMA